MTSAQSTVNAEKLTKRFGEDAGVFDIDLTVEAGSIVGLIGPSGSGKTTTVRLIAGLLQPDSGSVTVLGETPTDFKRETRAQLGYMPQESILYPALTLRQNLNFAGSLFGLRKGKKERIADLLDFVELSGAADRLPSRASGGEKRRVALAATLIHNPKLIFLDEPTAGLDPVLRRKFWDRFEELARSGRTLVVTTQYVGEAAYCDYVAVLAEGRVLTVDTPDGLKRQAFGGELVDVVFRVRPTNSAIESLQDLPGYRSHRWTDNRNVRLVVDDAATTIPEIGTWASQNQTEIERSEPHAPPFDDIFVQLIEKFAGPDAIEMV